MYMVVSINGMWETYTYEKYCIAKSGVGLFVCRDAFVGIYYELSGCLYLHCFVFCFFLLRHKKRRWDCDLTHLSPSKYKYNLTLSYIYVQVAYLPISIIHNVVINQPFQLVSTKFTFLWFKQCLRVGKPVDTLQSCAKYLGTLPLFCIKCTCTEAYS